jgi:hypothetical protein
VLVQYNGGGDVMHNFTAIFHHYEEDGKGYFIGVRLDNNQLVRDDIIIEDVPSDLKLGDVVNFTANTKFQEIKIKSINKKFKL